MQSGPPTLGEVVEGVDDRVSAIFPEATYHQIDTDMTQQDVSAIGW